MICPYCNKEMERGVIQSRNDLVWLRKKHFIGASWLHDGSVVLSDFSLIHGSAVTAYLCRDCKKVIIEYGGKSDKA